MNSSEFHDPQYKNSNFVLADLKRERWDAKEVTFGAYKLNESQVTSLSTNTETKVTLTDDKLCELDKQIVKIYKSKHGSKSNETAENKETQNANDSVEQKSANAYNAECIPVGGINLVHT